MPDKTQDNKTKDYSNIDNKLENDQIPLAEGHSQDYDRKHKIKHPASEK